MYSFALLCWEMTAYTVPFAGISPVQAALGVASHAQRPAIPAGAPAPVVSLMQWCWQQDASLRPTFERVR